MLIGAKALLAALLLTGTFFPSVGGFAGKGMAYRLPIFLAPALIVPIRWLRGRLWSVGLDVAFTVPFLLDTMGNALGLFDAWSSFDNVLHFLNWLVLVWGIATALRQRPGREAGMVWIAATGIGAIAAIAWEIAEYSIMQAGVGNLHLTYADTLGDLAAGSVGGAIGAWLAVRSRPRTARNRSL
jgi:hypothetical protein